ncbi:MAG: ABC transporter permease [Patescibacteria group bacterium]
MRFFDYLKMAFKNLWRRKIRTFLTIIAVLIGALAVVSLTSIAMGAQNVFMQQLEKAGVLNQVTVLPTQDIEATFFGGGFGETDDGIKLDDEIIAKVEAITNVIAVNPTVHVHPLQNMLIEGQEKKIPNANVSSMRINEASQVDLIAGRNFTSDDEMNKIILGHAFVDYFELDPNDVLGKKVTFTTWEGYHSLETGVPEPGDPNEDWQRSYDIEAEIIGVSNPGMNDRNSYVTDGWARRLMTEQNWGEPTEEEYQRVEVIRQEMEQQTQYGVQYADSDWPQPIGQLVSRDKIAEDGYQSLIALVNNAENVEAVATAVEELELGAITAKDFLDDILKLFLIIQIVLGAIGGIALVVAAIGIINTMVMATMERTREIGVMKAVGASRAAVRRLFTIEAAFIGFWGGFLGAASGYGLSKIVNLVAGRIMSDQSFSVDSIIVIPWYLLVGVIAFSTLVGLVSGLYPAAKAAKMDAIDALRRE